MCHYKSPLSLLAVAGRFKYYVQRTEWRNRNSSVWSLKTEHYAKQQCSAIIILARSHLAIFPGIIAELCVSARRPAAALAIFATKMCQIWERCVRECFVNMTISDQSPATVLLFLLPICCQRGKYCVWCMQKQVILIKTRWASSEGDPQDIMAVIFLPELSGFNQLITWLHWEVSLASFES